MIRVPWGGYAYAIQEGLNWFDPGPLRSLLETADFFCADPIFAGIGEYDGHEYEGSATAQDRDPRSHRVTPHYLASYWQMNRPKTERRGTIVLPPGGSQSLLPSTVLHELGHHLDSSLAERVGPPCWWNWSLSMWSPNPINDYARTAPSEAFACAFTEWARLGHVVHDEETDRLLSDERTVALFRALERDGLASIDRFITASP